MQEHRSKRTRLHHGTDRPCDEPATTSDHKQKVSTYWNWRPCGSWLAGDAAPESAEFFERTELARYQREPFIRRFARFEDWKGKTILEVGCGIGSDLSVFARHGARAFGVDLTHAGASLTTQRLQHYGVDGSAMVADCERLPFPNSIFDLVYSWGVIHHTPNTESAAREIVRVAKPGAQITVMIYNRKSLVALQAYLVYGLLKGRPMRRVSEIIASHLESPGTKAYTEEEARNLFSSLQNVSVTPIVTRYDLRIGRDRFLPQWMCSVVPQRFGYFMVIQGRKPLADRPSVAMLAQAS